MQTTNNKTALYVVIVIVVIAILGFAFTRDKDVVEENGAMTSTSTDSATNGTPSGANTGTNTGIKGATGTNTGTQPAAPAAIPSDATLMAIMNNTKIRVPSTGVDVVLTGGKASFTSGSTKGNVALGSILSKVTTNDGYDVFVTLTVTTTGAPFNYITLYHVKGDIATYTSTIPVGQGFQIQSVEAKADPAKAVANQAYPYLDSTGYLLTVKYLAFKNGEAATATPTVPKDFTARVKNHMVSM